MIDFLTTLHPNSNETRFLFFLERVNTRLDLRIGLSFKEFEVKHIKFEQVSNFRASYYDDESLPHSIIGFDYRVYDSRQNLYQWELNSDSCTWNFVASFPEIEEVIGDNI